MRIVPRSVENVIEALGKLPGVGPRTAERLAFHLLKSDPVKATTLSGALEGLHIGVRSCTICYNFAEAEICEVCDSPNRNGAVIAVVEEPLDIISLERTGQFNGTYHVLGGAISPIDGIGPEQLHIPEPLKRLVSDEVEEVIIATNASVEGESTAL